MTTAPGEFAVAVVEPDARARARLVRLLKEAFDPVAYASLDAMEDDEDFATPWVVVAGPSYADDTGLKEIRVVTRRRNDVAFVLTVDELSTDLLYQALHAGVRDVVTRPRSLGPLADAIEQVAEGLGVQPPARSADWAKLGPGRIVTVLAAKGGAGKSVLATNVAAALARRGHGRVALVDADLQFGDAAVLLGVPPERTIVDVLGIIRRLDADHLADLLLRHPATGLALLAAPVEPVFADQVGADDLVRILGVLRSFCDVVIVDTPAQLNDIVLAVVETADDVVLVCTPEIPNVKNAKVALQTLQLLNVPLAKVKLVVNRVRRRGGLRVADVERSLGLEAKGVVAADDVVSESVNTGIPAVLAAPRSDAAKSFEKLANLLAPVSDG